MNKFNAVLEPHPDGTLHLPLPAELRTGKVEVTATLRAVSEGDTATAATVVPISPPVVPLATPEMVKRRGEAFAALRAMGGLHDVIPDPVDPQSL